MTFWTFLDCYYACYFISVCGVKRLNVSIFDDINVRSCDLQSEIMYKNLQSPSTDIASFCYVTLFNPHVLSHKTIEHFAKAVSSTQHNLLSMKLSYVRCLPGCITILCASASTTLTSLN